MHVKGFWWEFAKPRNTFQLDSRKEESGAALCITRQSTLEDGCVANIKSSLKGILEHIGNTFSVRKRRNEWIFLTNFLLIVYKHVYCEGVPTEAEHAAHKNFLKRKEMQLFRSSFIMESLYTPMNGFELERLVYGLMHRKTDGKTSLLQAN